MQAIIVLGKTNSKDTDGQRFEKVAKQLTSSLTTDFKVPLQNLLIIRNADSAEIFEKLEEVFIESSKEDVCLFYIGHGSKKDGGGWAVQGTCDDILFYSELALALAHHGSRLIFVNDCCYAGLAEKALEFHAADSLLITASPENKVAVIDIIPNMLLAWKNGRKYEPKAFVSPSYVEERFGLYDNVVHSYPLFPEGHFLDLRAGTDLDYLMIGATLVS